MKNVPAAVDRKQKHPWLAGHRKPPLAIPKTSADLVQGSWQGLSIAAAAGGDESVVGIACALLAAGPEESKQPASLGSSGDAPLSYEYRIMEARGCLLQPATCYRGPHCT